MAEAPEVMLIIPCYNEDAILEKSIGEIEKVLEENKVDYGIMLIDDKSQDRTVEIAGRLAGQNPRIKLFVHEQNLGRGGTVSEGIRKAQSPIVGFIDIDLETPAIYLVPVIKAVQDGADISTGLRIYHFYWKDWVVLHRWIAHKAYKRIARHLFKAGLRDTETGCKFFRREKILPILDEIKDMHWFWDTEVMVRAYYRNLRIVEVPTLFVRKKDVPSSLKFFRDTWRYAKNLVRFRRELKGKGLL